MPAKRIHGPVALDGTKGFGAVRNGSYPKRARLQPGVLGPVGRLRGASCNDQSAVNGLYPPQFRYGLINETLWSQISSNFSLLQNEIPKK